jgi:nucleotide-binding universal stress UspA family protein
MFKQIISALKFTPASIRALQHAVELARVHQAKLLIFHGLDYRLGQCPDTDPALKDAIQEADQRFRAKIEPLLTGLREVSFERFPADPALDLCRLAQRVNADLIVLGCHQKPGKMSLGRVDYVGITILEKAPCPVMLIPVKI